MKSSWNPCLGPGDPLRGPDIHFGNQYSRGLSKFSCLNSQNIDTKNKKDPNLQLNVLALSNYYLIIKMMGNLVHFCALKTLFYIKCVKVCSKCFPPVGLTSDHKEPGEHCPLLVHFQIKPSESHQCSHLSRFHSSKRVCTASLMFSIKFNLHLDQGYPKCGLGV